MDFSTIVVLVLIAAVGYTLFKAFSKKESVIEAVKEEIAEVKVVATKAEAAATKAKATVKKATTRKPKATAK